MKRELFNFKLPTHLIAQKPSPIRDEARLLVVDTVGKSVFHSVIRDLPNFLPHNVLCVPNDVKVRHARLSLRRSGGGKGEALLLRSMADGCFEALVRPGASLRPGKRAEVVDPISNKVLAELLVEDNMTEGRRCVRISDINGYLDWDAIDCIGQLPLPKYISHLASSDDEDRYQTVFCSGVGEAVAAPTSGLHFTNDLIDKIKIRGGIWSPVRLHVGLGTFVPMKVENIQDHVMHEERYEIVETTASILENAFQTNSHPVMAIGTTSLRTMEAAWDGISLKRSGSTNIFIKPGYKIRTADFLLTNFHLPKSTLFVLISAILGLDFAHSVYSEAIKEQYRFFSYGDAMLILNVH